MSPQQIIFIFFAFLLLAGAVAVVTMRNLVHAALCMAFCFFAVAGLFVLLEAPFLAMVAILIGIGAISILIIFAIMLTRGAGALVPGTVRHWPLVLALAVMTFGGLTALITAVAWPAAAPSSGQDATRALGFALVDPNQYALPFEVASVLLLITLIGSVSIAQDRK